MKLISPLLKHLVYPGLSRSGYLRRREHETPVVLTYHGLLPPGYKPIDPVLDGNLVTPEQFRRHLEFLRRHYHVISPESFLRWINGDEHLPVNSVLLTCDDGLRNNLSEMLPILLEFRFACLFFVTSAGLDGIPAMLWCDELLLMLLEASSTVIVEWPDIAINLRAEGRQGKTKLWWELVRRFSRLDHEERELLLGRLRDHLGLSENWKSIYHHDSRLSRRFALMLGAEVQELVEAGMSIGAHTSQHSLLPQLPAEMARKEISENRERLKQTLGHEIWALAYPFGNSEAVTSREIEMVEKAGFACAFINENGESVFTNRYAIPRVHVTAGMTMGELEAHLSGFHRSLRNIFLPSQEPVTANAT